jgi:signal peptidase I
MSETIKSMSNQTMVDSQNPTKPTGSKSSKKPEEKSTPSTGFVARETLESFAVALILAFMFRAFVAEIFVIPTGSMAPTLMGAHKDVKSPESGEQYQCGVSFEFDNETGKKTDEYAVGTTSMLSRRTQLLDLENNANHTTFSGDRIIVSKFSYLWNAPKRWDVIVFKFPGKAAQNYIKRCVGLPNETLRIQHGDIYVRPEGANEFAIARKPASVAATMLQPISDTIFPTTSIAVKDLPSAWQPYPEPGKGNLGWELEKADQEFNNGWVVGGSGKKWSAKFEPSTDAGSEAWLRFHHRVVSWPQWGEVERTGELPAPIPRYSSRCVTDFVPYNSSVVKYKRNLYDEGGRIRRDLAGSWSSSEPWTNQFHPSSQDRTTPSFENDGRHWTGDLAIEFELRLGKPNKDAKLTLDLVEAGRRYYCEIDPNNGQAVLSVVADGEKIACFEDEGKVASDQAIGSTSVRFGSNRTLKLANVDNTLHLWVDGSLVEFSPSNRVVTDNESTLEKHFPHSTVNDPLDAAPAGIGVRGTSLAIERARVWRDIYYIAAGRGDELADNNHLNKDIARSIYQATGKSPAYPDAPISAEQLLGTDIVTDYCNRFYPNASPLSLVSKTAMQRDIFYSSPQLWDNAEVFKYRRRLDFVLGEDEFFPMGDNSSASADARGWEHNALPRELLIGRAVCVFWPHVWMSPIPYLPNFWRMGLIR